MLAALAKRRNIAVLALTDHDTVEGLADFAGGCRENGIACISGIEMSAKAEPPMAVHILGYRLKRPEGVEDAMAWIVDRRNDRNIRMCSRLRELGFDIEVEDIEGEARGQIVARPHFASLMVKRGYVPNREAAFSKYLGRGGLAYEPRDTYSSRDCISIIRDAGGLPVLAHPNTTRLEGSGLAEMLGELKSLGLWGMECVSSHFSSEMSLEYLKLADRFSLYPTAGSDFHGGNRPAVDMGVQVGEDFLPWARLGVSI